MRLLRSSMVIGLWVNNKVSVYSLLSCLSAFIFCVWMCLSEGGVRVNVMYVPYWVTSFYAQLRVCFGLSILIS